MNGWMLLALTHQSSLRTRATLSWPILYNTLVEISVFTTIWQCCNFQGSNLNQIFKQFLMWVHFPLKSDILRISKGWINIKVLCNVDSDGSFQYDIIHFIVLLLCYYCVTYSFHTKLIKLYNYILFHSIQFNLFCVRQIQEGSLDPEAIEHVN